MKKQPPKSAARNTVGILALQGSFAEHAEALKKLKVQTRLIRSLADTKGVTACIIPGGESTTIMQLLEKTKLGKWLIRQAKTGMPIYGTCAGMIVLAQLKLIDIELRRNGYGPQLYSFEDKIEIFGKKSDTIFIRAPIVKKVGSKVKILAKHGRDPVLLQQKNILVSSFHPELSGNVKIYEYFLHK